MFDFDIGVNSEVINYMHLQFIDVTVMEGGLHCGLRLNSNDSSQCHSG